MTAAAFIRNGSSMGLFVCLTCVMPLTSCSCGLVENEAAMPQSTTESLYRAHRWVRIGGAAEVCRYGYISRRGKWVIQPTFDAAYSFSEGLAPVKIDGKWGYVDKTGRLAISPRYESAPSAFSEGYAVVPVEGGEQFIDSTGTVAIEEVFDSAWPFMNGLAFVRRRGRKKWIVICRNGQPAWHRQFDGCGGQFSPDGLSVIKIGKRWGVVNRDGKIITEPQFLYALSYREGLACVQVRAEKGWGYIDRNGEFAIPSQFDDARAFSEGLAAVNVGGMWGYIDKTGRMIIKPQFKCASQYGEPAGVFSDGLAYVCVKEYYGFVDVRGNIVIDPQFRRAFPFRNGLAAVVGQEGKREPRENRRDVVAYIDMHGVVIWQAPLGSICGQPSRIKCYRPN